LLLQVLYSFFGIFYFIFDQAQHYFIVTPHRPTIMKKEKGGDTITSKSP